jgi:hypothetical protein
MTKISSNATNDSVSHKPNEDYYLNIVLQVTPVKYYSLVIITCHDLVHSWHSECNCNPLMTPGATEFDIHSIFKSVVGHLYACAYAQQIYNRTTQKRGIIVAMVCLQLLCVRDTMLHPSTNQ